MLWLLMCVRGNMRETKHSYTLAMLRKVGFSSRVDITTEFQRRHNIPLGIARSPGSPWIVVGSVRRCRRRRERRQKRGCRGGLLVRLRKQPYKPPLPSIFLTNARSIRQQNRRTGVTNGKQPKYQGLQCDDCHGNLVSPAHPGLGRSADQPLHAPI